MLAAAVLGLLAAPALASAKTIVLSPSRSGNDTAALQAAFAAAGRGGTVQLTAGHFTINDILVSGFRGTFRGAGQGRTVIDCPPEGVGLDTIDNAGFTYLLCFKDSAVTVSDLSFDITPIAPAAPWTGWGFTDADFVEAEVCTIDDTATAFERVDFAGSAGDANGFPGGYNVDQAINALGDPGYSAGSYTMDGCSCTTPEGLWTEGLSAARIAIGASQGNVFTSSGMGCSFNETSASTVTVANNRFQNGNQLNGSLYSAGVAIEQDPGLGLAPSRYLVSDNSFKVGPPADAVDLWDLGFANGEGQLIKAVVCDNTMVLTGSLDLPFVVNAGGIGEGYAQNVSVLANRISGTGAAAIYLGTSYIGDDAANSVSGWKIIGNDVRGVTALPQSAGGPGAPIWLGPGTTDCTVIGGPAPTYVFNQGTDNTLINATPVDPPAAAATPLHALKQMKHLKGMMLP